MPLIILITALSTADARLYEASGRWAPAVGGPSPP